ncbi:hypothetical protein P8452_57540 [Trifolium repens]|nr:hypothetical protein P8452_57540 [Trifolium repens]
MMEKVGEDIYGAMIFARCCCGYSLMGTKNTKKVVHLLPTEDGDHTGQHQHVAFRLDFNLMGLPEVEACLFSCSEKSRARAKLEY